MRLLHHISELADFDQPLHLALGVFDGVHLGHQAVINAAAQLAKKSDGLVGVVTFNPHPISVLKPQHAPKRLLASIEHKSELLAELGVDFLLLVEFTKEFANNEPELFISELVNANGQLKSLAMGEDWKFGKARRGNVELLKTWGDKHHFTVSSVGPIKKDGERISSTRIRQAIRDGNLTAASNMLGQPYEVWGQVEKGKQLGRTIGFPTANLNIFNEQLPPNGVYAVTAKLGEKLLTGVANLGYRPTTDQDEHPIFEVHLFDFDQDIYDQTLRVTFEKFLRPEQKFDSIATLVKQIEYDAAEAKNFFTTPR